MMKKRLKDKSDYEKSERRKRANVKKKRQKEEREY